MTLVIPKRQSDVKRKLGHGITVMANTIVLEIFLGLWENRACFEGTCRGLERKLIRYFARGVEKLP